MNCTQKELYDGFVKDNEHGMHRWADVYINGVNLYITENNNRRGIFDLLDNTNKIIISPRPNLKKFKTQAYIKLGDDAMAQLEKYILKESK